MPRSGPKPKPTPIREAMGNPGRRPLPTGTPKPESALPKVPPHLQGEAAKEWRRIGPILRDLGLMTSVDRAALAMYCSAWGRHVEAEQELAKTGPIIVSRNGFPMQNPWLAVSKQGWLQAFKMLAEFGLSPSARTRLTTDDAGDEDDDFARWARGE